MTSSCDSVLLQEMKELVSECDRLINSKEIKLEALIDQFYTDDAIIMPPTGTTHVGKNDILEIFQRMYSSWADYKYCSSVEYAISTDQGVYTRSTYAVLDHQGKQIESGSYVTLWKKVANQYKVFSDIWTSTKSYAM